MVGIKVVGVEVVMGIDLYSLFCVGKGGNLLESVVLWNLFFLIVLFNLVFLV